jgi:NAD(P)-dependent dehydrogenase (short-subunit alcohol dehydrogenase family)
MADVAGKCVIVTGASDGVAAVLSERFAMAGASRAC